MDVKKILKLIAILACTQPIFLLTLKEWGNGVLIVSALISLGFIPIHHYLNNQLYIKWTSCEIWFVAAFFTPLTTTFFSALIRHDLYWEQFDSPSRFALAAILYSALRNIRFKISNFFVITIPFGICCTFLYQIVVIGTVFPSVNRATTHFMDPIMFGYISLSLGLTSLFMAISLPIEKHCTRTLNFTAGMLGVYLSILSQSRTGWFAIPCIVYLYILKFKKNSTAKSKLFVRAVIIACCIAILPLYPIVQSRLGKIVDEVNGYTFEGVAPDTSIGLRITYLRIAAHMVPKKLLSGYGDTARIGLEFPEDAKKYSSTYVQDTIFKVGFHNELVASTIRSGILGFISVLAVFFIPFILFFKKIPGALKMDDRSPLFGLIVITVVSMSSLTIETFGLKFATSYYACLVAVIAVDVLKHSRIERKGV
jgi:O-antigen ligase